LGYAEHNLISGESISYHGHLHAAVLGRTLLVSFLLDAIAIALIVVGATNRDMDFFKFLAPALLLLLFSGILTAGGVLSRKAAEFVVTNKRVIVKTGIIHKRTAEIFLNKVETVGVDQPITGRMLGYGTITVSGTGGTCEQFHNIANPFEFRRQIQEQIGAGTGQSARTGQMIP
jgi:uncharacterized membrane protein YdbT with pleckstrin-like domain